MPFWGNTRAQSSARSAHMPATCTTSGVASGCTGLAQCARNAVCGKVARGERRAVAPDSVGHRSRPTREPGRVSSLARSGRTVGAAAPAGPFAGSCDILPHRRGRRMFEAECCYACIGKSGTQDPMSARWWLPAWATSQGPEGRRANSGSDTLRLSRRQGWPGNSRELDGRVWKSSVFTITPRIPYHTPIFGHYGMVWYHNPVQS